jgi:Zn-dependent peptidase ImmA (M78 family)
MARSLKIDRSDLADTAQSDKLAELLIAQLEPQLDSLLPLPIEAVAESCGILEIRPLETDNFEGGLIQDAHKEHGYILVKAGQNPERSRFTIAHELGHFVNLRHVAPIGSNKLLCSKDDLRATTTALDKRLGIEAQANEFAACLLMPKRQIAPLAMMSGSPEISNILKLQNLCGVSKEAAARRYTELHGDDFAVVFSSNGKMIYSVRGGDFPWLNIKPKQELFRESLARTFSGDDGIISEQEDTNPYWWLDSKDAAKWELWEEVLIQENGYRLTLLLGDRKDNDE